MTLAEIKPMHGESLYDRDGNLVGKWNGERGMFRDCFAVRERTCRNVAVTPLAFRCGECDWFDKNRCDFNFCPNCGAKVVK